MTARRPPGIYDNVTEREWQNTVIELLEWNRWVVYHTHDSRRSQPGFPDVVALHPPSADKLVLELKTEKGKATPAQLQWLAWFDACGVEAQVARPSDIDQLIARARKPR